MPRSENEDFDPKKRSREDIDRTVPKDEDYYNYSPEDIDLNFNSKKRLHCKSKAKWLQKSSSDREDSDFLKRRKKDDHS